MRALTISAAMVIAAVWCAPAAGIDEARGRVTDAVLEQLHRARASAGVGRLERRPALDRAARARAGRLARSSRERRLDDRRPIEADLRQAEAAEFAAVRSRIEFTSGSADPAAAFSASWASSGGAWRDALDPRRAGVGAAHVRAADGWDVFVALLVDDPPPPPDPSVLRDRALDAVNDERARRGHSRLTIDDRLTAVAEAHSRDMARRRFFAHRAPDGSTPALRARRAGIGYRKIGENIQRNRGYADPVDRAVRGWLGSRPHRRAMLDPTFTRTGMGVHVADDGEVFFTQLFLEPPAGD